MALVADSSLRNLVFIRNGCEMHLDYSGPPEALRRYGSQEQQIVSRRSRERSAGSLSRAALEFTRWRVVLILLERYS